MIAVPDAALLPSVRAADAALELRDHVRPENRREIPETGDRAPAPSAPSAR